MTGYEHLVDLGPPGSALKNSLIISGVDEEREIIDVDISQERFCFFNGAAYPQGSFIKTTGSILQCDRGTWVDVEVEEEF